MFVASASGVMKVRPRGSANKEATESRLTNKKLIMKPKKLCRCCGETITGGDRDEDAFLCASCQTLLEDESPFQAAHLIVSPDMLTGRHFDTPALELIPMHS